mmetsp:Transcript_11460/g.9881  ORF Transcript_11460/g.9881 Transcript_11460/m.9881 type:complete len:236 (-) Transcript_11460:200-907(-)
MADIVTSPDNKIDVFGFKETHGLFSSSIGNITVAISIAPISSGSRSVGSRAICESAAKWSATESIVPSNVAKIDVHIGHMKHVESGVTSWLGNLYIFGLICKGLIDPGISILVFEVWCTKSKLIASVMRPKIIGGIVSNSSFDEPLNHSRADTIISIFFCHSLVADLHSNRICNISKNWSIYQEISCSSHSRFAWFASGIKALLHIFSKQRDGGCVDVVQMLNECQKVGFYGLEG